MSLASLDLKLGVRMLIKYPGLTIVGGLAMAFAIWTGAVIFQIISLITNPVLPLPDGDRIVQIQNWDVAASGAEPRALRDFLVWRSSLSSVTDLGAWREISPTLLAPDGDARVVSGAEISATAFRIDPARPLMGRGLTAADEQPGAAPVVVVGYELWRSRFESDPNVLGRSVQLGESYATVVGVMPPGFAFPISHELWIPFRPALFNQQPRQGPAISVFGRLAPGATLATAQAEMRLLGQRAAEELPETHERLQPRVAPYATVFYQPTGINLAIMLSINLFAIMLLVLVCGNVALLMFARAATRENELVVRSALGASRGRIVTQFVAEALVLGSVAAAVGLAAAGFGLGRWGKSFLELNIGRLPFWYDVSLSTGTVIYAVGLTLLGALIAGMVPALKATHNLGVRLRAGSAGGGGLKFGGIWTAVIISQVAATVAFPAVAYVQQRELMRIRSYDVGFPSTEYLGAQLEMSMAEVSSDDTAAVRAVERQRFGSALETLRTRMAAEPGVAGVTFVDQLPREFHRERRVELDDGAAVGGEAPEVSLASIDPSYFEVLESPIIAGRGFHTGDATSDARVVIVDQGFAAEVLKGKNPIGRRVRFQSLNGEVDAKAPWYEIVGVARELGMAYMTHHRRTAGVYFPVDLSSGTPLFMMIHAQSDPMALSSRVRALTAAVDPTIQISELTRVDQVTDAVQWVLGLWIRITAVLIATALVLSLAGIYAVLSFTVARRTREIGVRIALGASRWRVVAEIFRRPLTQVGLGVVAGGILIGVGAVALSGGGLSLVQVALLIGYAGVMLAVCLLACIVPTRRALSVEPTVALQGN